MASLALRLLAACGLFLAAAGEAAAADAPGPVPAPSAVPVPAGEAPAAPGQPAVVPPQPYQYGAPAAAVPPQYAPNQPYHSAPAYRPFPNGYSTRGAGPAAGVGPFWAPGGYEPRSGSPYYYHDPNGGQYVVTGDPYFDHFGPGFHSHSLYGHYRFPYYTYRAPWYYPGRAVYNRDTNLPW